jgi:acetyl-CoA carboxylase carboxyl transferase subunit alpha
MRKALFTDFTPLAGDRAYADDHAIQMGMARFDGRAVMVIGHEKGDDTASRLKHNFGMARPGRLSQSGARDETCRPFSICRSSRFVDTAGAYPGIGAEERGQAEAIARSTEQCLSVKVPTVSVIIGEGGSGGAIALATANMVFMLEHAIYSVISPEGAASILWRDSARAPDAACGVEGHCRGPHKPQSGRRGDRGAAWWRSPRPSPGDRKRAQRSWKQASQCLRSAEPHTDWRANRQDKFLAIGRTLGV